MKILQLTYSLSSGGAERFAVDLCNELAKKAKVSVTLVSILDDKIPGMAHYLHDVSENVEFISLGAKKGLSLKAFWRVLKLVLKIKPDIVHAHCGLLLLLLPVLFCKKTRFIHTLHNITSKTLSSKHLKFLYKFFYKYFIYPVTISQKCDISYKDFFGLKNATCIYNGRSPVRLTNSLIKVQDEVKSYTQKRGLPVFIHVARYAEQKNQQMLVNVFERLDQEGDEFVLLILGQGHEYAPYFSKIESDKIIFLGVKDNVGDYLMCSDYFVLTSLWEGLPISLLEAMSVGCIPVCTPAGGIPDIIKHGINGFLSNNFLEEDFFKLVKTIIQNHIELCYLKPQVLQTYKDNFTMEACATLYHELYNV